MNVSQVASLAQLNAVLALHNGGTLVLYTGSIPATPETAATGTALVTATYAATAFGAPAFASGSESASASFTAAQYAPAAGGVAGYARAFESNGTTVIADYTVGTSGTDITIGNTTIQTGTNVSFTQTMSLPAV